MKLKIDIATNNFKHGGGTERYTLDLVKGLNRQNITPAVYATKFDHGIPEYAMIEPHLVDQRRTLKKLRSFLFSSRLAQTRKNSAAKLIACHHADYADLLICGGTHLGYLHHMAQKPNEWYFCPDADTAVCRCSGFSSRIYLFQRYPTE
ncbi:glycosyltransferase, partial [Neisseria gonorrhoeae]|uniref:glycosyltransferase n=1 Tax=Neisseria gonorrhoeae TaxID=485 RepID=UPI0028048DF8